MSFPPTDIHHMHTAMPETLSYFNCIKATKQALKLPPNTQSICSAPQRDYIAHSLEPCYLPVWLNFKYYQVVVCFACFCEQSRKQPHIKAFLSCICLISIQKRYVIVFTNTHLFASIQGKRHCKTKLQNKGHYYGFIAKPRRIDVC